MSFQMACFLSDAMPTLFVKHIKLQDVGRAKYSYEGDR